MLQRTILGCLLGISLATGCGGGTGPQDGSPSDGANDVSESADASDGADTGEASSPGDASVDSGDGATDCGTPAECGRVWEQNATNRLAAVLDMPTELAAFLRAVPKGGDLHNHLSGAVYGETYLTWAASDGDCINSTSFSAVGGSQCATTGNQPAPGPGPFYDQILRAWSMLDFVAGTQNGHDHFFATFGKYGVVAGAHRDDSIADVLTRAAAENEVYVETMFNLGTNVGTLAASLWSTTLTEADLPAFYDTIMANPGFAAQLDRDVTAVTNAATRYAATLGCSGANPPPACGVRVRFIAQVARTAANDQIFGQLISSFEMATRTPQIVAVNLSSPEDDTASLRNYDLHMAMLNFLYNHYTVTHQSPLHITLHAGEVVPLYLPAGYSTANTFHIRHAVEIGHAERIGHGLDILSETDGAALMDEMHDRNVLVEVCLSSNDQILQVSGTDHPLSQYMMHGVPVALATDDQGVSRSSMAGEYARAVSDQQFDYLQLKAAARNSLEHAFLPGASLWASFGTVQPVAACAPPDTLVPGESPSADCQAFLAGSERAQAQWELEHRFRVFESHQ